MPADWTNQNLAEGQRGEGETGERTPDPSLSGPLGGGDELRASPELPKVTVPPQPRHDFPYTTDDEAYRRDDLPDGLRTDGTHPRHWGVRGESDQR